MTRTRTLVVIVVTISIAVGLSLPLANAYAGASGGLGFFSGIIPRNANHQQTTGYPGIMGSGYGYGGMMGGDGATSAGSAYGHGMMGGYYGNGATSNYSAHGPGMMGSFYDGDYAGMMTIQGQSISIQQAVVGSQTPPAYAQIIKSNNTISFHSQTVSVLALAMMPEEAVNITGTELPSYASGDVFVIYGLINPTLVIPAGATLQFNVVNLDDDMYHNLVVSSISPPYPYMAMQGMMYSYGHTDSANTFYPFASMMGFLPPANYAQGDAREYSYTLTFNQTGTLWYLCTYPGHAQLGMYGQIIVTGR